MYACLRENHIYNKNLLLFPFGVGVSFQKYNIETFVSRTHSLISSFTHPLF